MKTSGTCVTGMFRSVAVATSTLSAPTLPRAIILQFSRLLMMLDVMRRPLAMMASASLAAAMNSSSVPASDSTISASIAERASISSS